MGWSPRSFQRRSKGIMKEIWQTLIQPKVDICSQLWSPGDQDSINKLESVQHHFTSKVTGLEGTSCRERLQVMQLYFQEGRREQLMILSLWKISQGMVGGYDVRFSYSPRRGRLIIPNQIVSSAPALVRRAREASLSVKYLIFFLPILGT